MFKRNKNYLFFSRWKNNYSIFCRNSTVLGKEKKKSDIFNEFSREVNKV